MFFFFLTVCKIKKRLIATIRYKNNIFSRQFAIGTRPRVRDVPAFDLFFRRCAKRYDVYTTKLDFQPRRRLFLTNIRTINKSLRNIANVE